MSLRILNNNTSVNNVYLGNEVIAYNLAPKDFTEYIELSPGNYELIIKHVGSDEVFVKSLIQMDYNMYYTAVIMNGDLVFTRDDRICPNPGKAIVKFINASNELEANVFIGNVLLFSNVRSGTATLYDQVELGQTKVDIQNVKTPTRITIANPYFASGGVYTIVSNGMVADDSQGSCEQLQENFDIPAYMGKWHVISSIPQSFENSCQRAAVEYTQLQNHIKMVNNCYDENWNLSRSVQASARLDPLCTTDGSLRVIAIANDTNKAITNNVSSGVGSPQIPGANYLVHKTDYNGFSVVGTPNRSGLWILCRKSKMALDQYQELAIYCKQIGYDISLLRVKYHALTR